MQQNYNISKNPIRKAHLVGSSIVLTLDPTHVRRLGIDNSTFFVQKPLEDGILLRMCRLQFANINGSEKNERSSVKPQKARCRGIESIHDPSLNKIKNETGVTLQRHPNSVLTYRVVKQDELL
jgi:hypothetical protein